jgi:hypothetical protein
MKGEAKPHGAPHPPMSSGSHRTHLVLTALAASASTGALIGAYSAWDRRRRRLALAQDVARAVAAPAPAGGDAVMPAPAPVSDVPYDEELVREQLARNYAFFGEDGMRRVRGGRVVIVGCGGVGSWAAVMLARSYAVLLPSSIKRG